MKIMYFQEALKSLQFYRGTSKPTPKILEEMALLSLQTESEDKASVVEKSSDAAAEKELLNQREVTTSDSDMSPWKTLCKFM